MKIIQRDALIDETLVPEEEFILAISSYDFSVLTNGLNDLLNRSHVRDFEMRMGVSRNEADFTCAEAAGLAMHFPADY